MEEIQHSSAVLATIECHTHLIEAVLAVGCLHYGERMVYLGTQRARKE